MKKSGITLIGIFWVLLSTYGRFDPLAPFFIRSYLVQAFFALLTFGLLVSLLKRTGRALLFILPWTIPFRWLGLSPRETFLKMQVLPWQTRPRPSPDWFPDAFHHLPAIPQEGWVLFFLFFIGLIFYSLFAKKIPVKRSQWLVCVMLVLLGTWFHLSLRSPYTYLPHYEQEEAKQYWYHYYLFADSKGAVNLDYHCFRPAEELFLGSPDEVNILKSRLYPSFLAVAFYLWGHPLHIWLLLNVIVWFAGIVAIGFLAREFYPNQSPWGAMLGMALAQGVIVYVGQAKIYASAIAFTSVVIAIWIKEIRKEGWASLLAAAIIFALWQLSYENQPWYLGLLVLGWGLKVPWKRLLLTLSLSLFLHLGFLGAIDRLPGIVEAKAMTDISGDPIQNILELVRHFRIGKLALYSLMAVRGFGRMMLHGFNFVLLPAVLGLWVYRKEFSTKLLWALLLPAFLTYYVMEVGRNFYYTSFPRIIYSSHPSIFIAAGLGFHFLWGRWKVKGRSALVAAVLLYALYVNADVWGHPWIYYLWFNRNTGFSFSNL